MKRVYTVAEAFYAKSAEGEARELKLGDALLCDLEQRDNNFRFETTDGGEWFADRQTFEQCCIRARTN
jgi:hypothetical protein